MQANPHEIETAALGMEPQKRAELAARLIDSLESAQREAVDEAAIERLWLDEAQRRLARLDAGHDEAIPAERVVQELRDRLK